MLLTASHPTKKTLLQRLKPRLPNPHFPMLCQVYSFVPFLWIKLIRATAAESALSQAVDSTASDALTSLESALQTALSAAAAAVAGPTAAAAASVAEAMAAVTGESLSSTRYS